MLNKKINILLFTTVLSNGIVFAGDGAADASGVGFMSPATTAIRKLPNTTMITKDAVEAYADLASPMRSFCVDAAVDLGKAERDKKRAEILATKLETKARTDAFEAAMATQQKETVALAARIDTLMSSRDENAAQLVKLAAEKAELEENLAQIKAKAAGLDAEKTELQGKLDEITAKAARLDAENADLQGKLDEITAKAAENKEQSTALERSLEETRLSAATLQAQLAALKEDATQSEAEKAAQKAALVEQAEALATKEKEILGLQDASTKQAEALASRQKEIEALKTICTRQRTEITTSVPDLIATIQRLREAKGALEGQLEAKDKQLDALMQKLTIGVESSSAASVSSTPLVRRSSVAESGSAAPSATGAMTGRKPKARPQANLTGSAE